MVIDSAPDQAKPAAFDSVDGRRRLALPEQQLTALAASNEGGRSSKAIGALCHIRTRPRFSA